jgi:ATP-dependent exoDNAse (exonuclease V) beta subunit
VGLRADSDDERLMKVVTALVKPDESMAVDSRLFEEAIQAFKVLCGRPEVLDVYESGDVLHEVPFTLVEAQYIVRGIIDCLVHTGDRVTVLELKTGRPHADDAAQARIYRRAVEAIFPGRVVETRVVYADAAVG